MIAKRVTGGSQAGLFWLHTDRLGSIQAVTDATGEKLHRDYRPYGETRTSTGSNTESRGWIDQRNDSETGLTYLHARYFDPKLGIFLSADPIGVEGGLNEFGYGDGEPINSADRLGLDPQPTVLPTVVNAPICSPEPQPGCPGYKNPNPTYPNPNMFEEIWRRIVEAAQRALYELWQHQPSTTGGPTGPPVVLPPVVVACPAAGGGDGCPKPKVPAGSNPRFVEAVRDGFGDIWRRVGNDRCGALFGGSDLARGRLQATTYWEAGPFAGATRPDRYNVWFSATGPFMHPPDMGRVNMPGGASRFTGTTTGSYRGFMMGHELAHQLWGFSGFVADGGYRDSGLVNQTQSMRVLDACY